MLIPRFSRRYFHWKAFRIYSFSWSHIFPPFLNWSKSTSLKLLIHKSVDKYTYYNLFLFFIVSTLTFISKVHSFTKEDYLVVTFQTERTYCSLGRKGVFKSIFSHALFAHLNLEKYRDYSNNITTHCLYNFQQNNYNLN